MSKTYFFLNDTPVGGSTGQGQEVWFPKTGDGYFDKTMRQYFGTKRQKQNFLKAQGWREAGELYHPSKWDGNTGAMRRRG